MKISFVIPCYRSEATIGHVLAEIDGKMQEMQGYEYEVMACKKAIEEGRIECDEMPHSETIEIMRQMDEIRKQFGIVFPFEK